VDYSARAVIVPNPKLDLDEIGLPAHIYDQLLGDLRAKEKPDTPLVLLNRAPSLHKYSIQAAHAIRLDSGDAIQLNPLVCAGLGADFDGDTIAIHAPRSRAAIQEAERLLPSRHLLSVANGSFNLHLAQDIVAGLFLVNGQPRKQTVEGFRQLARKHPAEAARRAQEAMRAGFDKASRSGLTFSYSDIVEPEDDDWGEAYKTLSNAYITAELVGEEKDEANARKLEAKAREEDAAAWELLCKHWRDLAKGPSPNPIAVLLASGARGETKQLGQVSGFRGRIQNAQGVLLSHFVTSDFRQGVRPLEYFLCCHATRVAMADKKIMTGQAGELTRWLVEACYPMVIVEGNCLTRHPGGTLAGRAVAPQWLWGRTLAQPLSVAGVTYEAGRPIDDELLVQLAAEAGQAVAVRSPLDCLDYSIERPAICQACYGLDLGTGEPPRPDLAVGIVAGESIGERCTQLTMKTFHLGGAAGGGVGIQDARRLFRAQGKLKHLSVEQFLEKVDRIYKGVDHRHFEIVLRRMKPSDGPLVGVDRIAMTYPRHVLARASFVQATTVLAGALWRPDEARWALEGYKERMMLGRSFRRSAHV
jgi:DNA-directed RNA polymerase beta' subunit